jgi:hypothetical protein
LQNLVEQSKHPQLKELMAEASRSLARLDVDRLEELALSCKALSRGMAHRSKEAQTALALEAQESTQELAILARVLEATRANLHVMNRLRELRAGCFEYGKPPARQWARTEDNYGDN